MLLVLALGCESTTEQAAVSPERTFAGRVVGPGPERRVSRLPERIHFFGARRGLMATLEGTLHATSDGGRTWRRVGRVSRREDLLGRPLPRATIRDVEFVDRLHGWAASNRRVFRTVDGGRTWRGLRFTCGGPWPIGGIAFVDRSRGFALCGDQPAAGQQWKRLLATTDGGRTWQLRTGRRGITSSGYARGIDFVTREEGLMVLARVGIYRTSDGGRSWRSALFTGDWAADSTSWPTPKTIYAALWQIGLVRSDDAGRRWRQVYPRLSGPVAARSFSSPRLGIGAQTGGLFPRRGAILATADGGRTWRVRSRIRGLAVMSLVRSGREVWAVAYRQRSDGAVAGSARLLRTTDEGRSWTRVVAPRGSELVELALAERAVYLSTTAGLFRLERRSWRRLSRRELRDVEFLTEQNGFSIAGEHDLIRTSDGGRTWEPVTLPAEFRVLAISVHQPRGVWLTGNVCSADICRGRILHSADAGRTWTEIRFRAAVPPAATQWLSSTHGVAHFGEPGHYITHDAGRTWRFFFAR